MKRIVLPVTFPYGRERLGVARTIDEDTGGSISGPRFGKRIANTVRHRGRRKR